MTTQLSNGRNILYFVPIGDKSEPFRDPPNECLYPLAAARVNLHLHTLPSSEPEAMILSLNGFLSSCEHCNVIALSLVPVRVQDYRSVSSTERDLLWQLSFLIQRYNGERAPAACFPVDRKVVCIRLWDRQGLCDTSSAFADLDQICIPCIFRYSNVVVALFLERYVSQFSAPALRSLPFELDAQRRALAYCVSLCCEWRSHRVGSLTIFGCTHKAARHWEFRRLGSGYRFRKG